MSALYQGADRTHEALADLFAQGHGAPRFGIDERMYFDPNPERSSLNAPFAAAGYSLFNALGRFAPRMDKRWGPKGRSIPEVAEPAQSAAELVQRVQNQQEAALPSARPAIATVGRAQYDDEPPELPIEAYAHSGYDRDTEEAMLLQPVQNQAKTFSGNIIMGHDDFMRFVGQGSQQEDIAAWHGIARRSSGGDLELARWKEAADLMMSDEHRDQQGDLRYVFGTSASSIDSPQEVADTTSRIIPVSEDSAFGVGIQYDPRRNSVAASYGGEETALFIYFFVELRDAHALLRDVNPMLNAGTRHPMDVAQRAVSGNAYAGTASTMLGKASAEQRAIMLAGADVQRAANADAGTGKTFTSIGTMAQLLAGGMTPDQMSMVTFSRRGVGEFSEGIRSHFDTKQANDIVGSMQITSANALAQRVIRRSDPATLISTCKSFNGRTARGPGWR